MITLDYNQDIKELCEIHHLQINSNKVIRPGIDYLALNFLNDKLLTLMNYIRFLYNQTCFSYRVSK